VLVVSRRVIELSHEWGCHALRDIDTGDRIDPSSLPLPESVVERLAAWAARWDLTFDVEQPDKPKVDRWVLDELGRDGGHLWKAVLTSLPPTRYEVLYVHGDTVYRQPSELPPEWW
jgi:hypothetical protein